ncbi:MAG: carbohydrate ABC transporter permease [Beutenbergiaceae bacterium]
MFTRRGFRRSILPFIILVLAILWVVVPYYFLFVASVTPRGVVVDGFSPVTQVTWENFTGVMTGTNAIWPSIINSTIIALGATLMALLLGVPASYGLSRLRAGKLAQRVYISSFVLRGVPPVTLVIPYYVAFANLNLLDTLYGLVIVLMSLALPFVVWTMRVFFDAIPREMEEAASIDGANAMQRFLRINIPVVKIGIASTGLLSALLIFVDYIFVAQLGGPSSRTFSVYMTSFQQDLLTLVGPMAAAAIIGTLPMIVLFSFSQRYMQRMALAGVH